MRCARLGSPWPTPWSAPTWPTRGQRSSGSWSRMCRTPAPPKPGRTCWSWRWRLLGEPGEKERGAVQLPCRGDGTSGDAANDGRGEGQNRTQPRSRRSSRKPSTEDLASLPKGKGRMKQERSQLNVRIPTALKRRASAKAVLEGQDIGEVVEELLREYLEK